MVFTSLSQIRELPIRKCLNHVQSMNRNKINGPYEIWSCLIWYKRESKNKNMDARIVPCVSYPKVHTRLCLIRVDCREKIGWILLGNSSFKNTSYERNTIENYDSLTRINMIQRLS